MNSGFDLNNFNSFLQAASEQIACGTECQRQKMTDELESKYLDAESNLSLAVPKYEIAKKEYYTYVGGQSGYNQMLEEELNNKSELIVKSFKDNFNDEINKIKSLLETYDGILINFRNVLDLYTQYVKENVYLNKKLKTETNDVLTNERKTFYEDQNIDSLNGYYYYVLLVIYIITVFCYVIFSLFYPSQSSFMTRGLLFILFIALPFISTFVLGKIIQFIYWVIGLLPKNVYL